MVAKEALGANGMLFISRIIWSSLMNSSRTRWWSGRGTKGKEI